MSKGINESKYRNAILYICQRLGGQVFGKKKLYKLLYYVDFDHFEYQESMSPITGEEYKAWPMGPVPQNFPEVMAKMVEDGQIERTSVDSGWGNPTEVFTATEAPDCSVFSEDEKFILNRVIEKYGNLNGKQLEILTHAEAPYIATEPNDKIEYELAFYRGTDFHDAVAATR